MNRNALPSGSFGRFPALLLAWLLLCMAVALTAAAAAHGSAEDEGDLAIIPPDADNVELHRVKLVNGGFQQDHPVIMYKEDFVSEDFDPKTTEASPEHHHQRHYSHHHRSSKPDEKEEEKVYFDVLPDKPIVLNADLKSGPVSNLEAAQLVKPTKEDRMSKYPKKYHSRRRRQVNQLTSGFYGHTYKKAYLSSPLEPLYYVARLPVSGKKPILQGQNAYWKNRVQPVSIGSRDDFLIHDSDPSNADFSIFDRPRPTSNPNAPSASTTPPFGSGRNEIQPERQPPSSSSWATNPNTRPTARPAPPPAPTSKISSCVWAILNCCESGSVKIRYNCFEDFGCHGAFWGLNPCADQRIKDADETVSQASFSPSFSAASAPAPVAQASRPRQYPTASRQGAVQYPGELDYQEGSKCQRASQLCCGLPRIDSMYECFYYHGCEQSLSTIISGCS